MRPGTVALGYLDDGTWKAQFGLCRSNLLMRDLVGDQKITCNKELRITAHAGSLGAARNQMVRSFLDDTEAEWLFIVDSDMGFEDDTVDRLLASADPVERPIMGGLCFALTSRKDSTWRAPRYDIIPTVYEYIRIMREGEEYEVGFVENAGYDRNAVNQVAATGAACLLVHRGVFTSMREALGDNWFSPLTHATGEKGSARIYSEDFSFFIRCLQLKIPAFVDTSVKTDHLKGALTLNEELWEDYSVEERLHVDS